MSKIKEKSASVVQNVAAKAGGVSGGGGGLDMHLVTERLAAMSFPAEGLLDAASFKNHIDDVSAVLESRHPGITYYLFFSKITSIESCMKIKKFNTSSVRGVELGFQYQIFGGY